MAAVITETWKPVAGYEGLYEVSDQGRVKSLRLGRLMKPQLATGQKRRFKLLLVNGSSKKNVFVHTLVLEAFVGARPQGTECRHLNDDATDNSLENLVWGTRSENLADRVRNGILRPHKTHCKRGHEFTPENTWWPPSGNGSRHCRTCDRIRSK